MHGAMKERAVATSPAPTLMVLSQAVGFEGVDWEGGGDGVGGSVGLRGENVRLVAFSEGRTVADIGWILDGYARSSYIRTGTFGGQRLLGSGGCLVATDCNVLARAD